MLSRAHEAYDRGEWRAAIDLLRSVDDLEGLGADDLRRWAHAAQCAGRPSEALPVLERAVAAYIARGDAQRAAWAAILVASLRLEWGEATLANGWVQRAARLLEGLPVASTVTSRCCVLGSPNSPLACAEARRSLSRVLLAAGDRDAADVELGAAIGLFRRAGAGGQVVMCERLRTD